MIEKEDKERVLKEREWLDKRWREQWKKDRENKVSGWTMTKREDKKKWEGRTTTGVK